MGKIICIRTRRKWKRPSHTGGGPARWARGIGAPGENGFEPIGEIAERVVRQLARK